jgi:hypothetical protein
VNFLDTAPDRIDDVARVVREIVHPGIRDEAGYAGYIVLGHPETGSALGVTLWESSEAREASRRESASDPSSRRAGDRRDDALGRKLRRPVL